MEREPARSAVSRVSGGRVHVPGSTCPDCIALHTNTRVHTHDVVVVVVKMTTATGGQSCHIAAM